MIPFRFFSKLHSIYTSSIIPTTSCVNKADNAHKMIANQLVILSTQALKRGNESRASQNQPLTKVQKDL